MSNNQLNLFSDEIKDDEIYYIGFMNINPRMSRMNIMNLLFQEAIEEDYVSQMEEKMMEIATRESLSHYKTYEKKPNVKLDIKSQLVTTEHKEDSCSICSSNFETGENITQLECKHVFHTSCIGEWVMYKSECPCCRASIQTKML